jgi:hypothetical protein
VADGWKRRSGRQRHHAHPLDPDERADYSALPPPKTCAGGGNPNKKLAADSADERRSGNIHQLRKVCICLTKDWAIKKTIPLDTPSRTWRIGRAIGFENAWAQGEGSAPLLFEVQSYSLQKNVDPLNRFGGGATGKAARPVLAERPASRAAGTLLKRKS